MCERRPPKRLVEDGLPTGDSDSFEELHVVSLPHTLGLRHRRMKCDLAVDHAKTPAASAFMEGVGVRWDDRSKSAISPGIHVGHDWVRTSDLLGVNEALYH